MSNTQGSGNNAAAGDPPVRLRDALRRARIEAADRSAVVEALTRPGSKARNERGALAIGQFKRIGRLRWQAPEEAERPGS